MENSEVLKQLLNLEALHVRRWEHLAQFELLRYWSDELAKPRYDDRKRLLRYGFKVYSQSDEDGIIQEIFNRIGTTNRIFVEFGFVLAFAVLHHIPGKELRRQILRKVRRLLKYKGSFIHSEWQFLNSPRLVARIQPWSTLGLSELAVDPGDYLLDWRQGGSGLRYVHFFQIEELQQLADISGFQVVETFYSDGVGKHLGLYQTWRAK